MSHSESACFGASAEAAEHEDSRCVDFPVFLYVHAIGLPCAEPAVRSLRHRGLAGPRSAPRSVGDHELDVLAGPVRRAEVATLPGRADRTHEVQVLRHRLPLQPHGFEGLSAVLVTLTLRVLGEALELDRP